MASCVFHPATSTDTGYWFNNGGWFSSTGYNGRTAAAGNYSGNSESAWARFQNVAIPQGATITSAILRLTSNGNHTSSPIAWSVRAELADSPSAPTSIADANSRAKSSGVDWFPGDWTAQAYDSPDIASAIQEVVDRAGWAAGNALQIFVLDSASSSGAERVFYCFGNGTGYPELHVAWQVPTTLVAVSSAQGSFGANAASGTGAAKAAVPSTALGPTAREANDAARVDAGVAAETSSFATGEHAGASVAIVAPYAVQTPIVTRTAAATPTSAAGAPASLLGLLARSLAVEAPVREVARLTSPITTTARKASPFAVAIRLASPIETERA
ncbi:hypothetical protein DesfrDRAFT_0442 [Solidesulfovibrio fructosivorans JJ]]|uniref:Uncharacterized protein n=1 Tax=Solidesulfovibrio fructosivorans JJ] TaxID=596151 RepID=E1JS43_SOLFR|nr:hypothetical protein [Solidesulfovibrio fructosivorans]EFL52812.1 hypothetical protein DesfrDRAFT_0442 [Solidesulfovibrio fructosivorans JJ]]